MSKNVLLIQHPNSQRNLIELLKEKEINASAVSKYSEAIDALKLNTPSLILMDFCSGNECEPSDNQLAKDLLGNLNSHGALSRIPVLVTGEDKELLKECAQMGVLVESNGECEALALFASKILE